MPAFMKLGDIAGEATDLDHNGWIIIESMTAPTVRTIPVGAKDQQRTKGETVLQDVCVRRQVDKSTPKLIDACANGTFFREVDVHFCTTVKNRQEPYKKYKLYDVVVSHYDAAFTSSGIPLPHENVHMGYTRVEITYVTVDPKTGDKRGIVAAKYNPAEGRG